MKAPIHSIKHYVQMTLSTVTTGAKADTILAEGVLIHNQDTVNEVIEGALVKAVFVELWVIGSVSNQFFTIILGKFPSGVSVASTSQLSNLGQYSNKKNILYTTQGLASTDGIAGPVAVIRQWDQFFIPRLPPRLF